MYDDMTFTLGVFREVGGKEQSRARKTPVPVPDQITRGAWERCLPHETVS